MRYLAVPRALCFVLYEDRVLLIRRSPRERLFPGKINGVGGHIESGETVFAAAAREVEEETGLQVTDLTLVGVINLPGTVGQAEPLPSGVIPGVVLFVFTAQSDHTQVTSSDEGELMWVPLSAVHDLDWVDGHPGLLLQALEARKTGRLFLTL